MVEIVAMEWKRHINKYKQKQDGGGDERLNMFSLHVKVHILTVVSDYCDVTS